MNRVLRYTLTVRIFKFLITDRKLKIRTIAIKSGIVERSIYRWVFDDIVPQQGQLEKLMAFAKRYGWRDK